ncbi:MAG TPA: DUF2442 domain-containing protein [Spirochaetota bacterium]|nr:DUF2442 domain-containing protein [Spirochaetota bacterium]
MFFDVIDARHEGDHRIRLFFRDGKSGIVDLGNYIGEGEIYSDIRDTREFAKFCIEFGTITWKNGEIDIAPETLYEKATGEKIELTPETAYKAV